MKLIIGGAWQGKTEAAIRRYHLKKEDIADGRSCEFDAIDSCIAVHHFHELIRRMLQKDWESQESDEKSGKKEHLADELITRIQTHNPKIIIISDEIGYGIVPLDPFERFFREQTGRICCKIAQHSTEVIRVACGIPMVIKP